MVAAEKRFDAMILFVCNCPKLRHQSASEQITISAQHLGTCQSMATGLLLGEIISFAIFHKRATNQ